MCLQELLQCSHEQWSVLDKSTYMLDLMLEWEVKKTDYQINQVVRLQLGDVLDLIGMAVDTFKAVVLDFSSRRVSPTCLPEVFHFAYRAVTERTKQIRRESDATSMSCVLFLRRIVKSMLTNMRITLLLPVLV